MLHLHPLRDSSSVHDLTLPWAPAPNGPGLLAVFSAVTEGEMISTSGLGPRPLVSATRSVVVPGGILSAVVEMALLDNALQFPPLSLRLCAETRAFGISMTGLSWRLSVVTRYLNIDFVSCEGIL